MSSVYYPPMNLNEYKKKKSEQLLQQQGPGREKCFTCFRPMSSCLCSHITKFPTKTMFVLLIHPMEAKKQRVGTGRITVSFLNNSKMFMGVDFSNDRRVNTILDDQANRCVVLYPGKEAFNISKEPISKLELKEDKQLVVFIIDGTWPCARKMMIKSTRIRKLPRICFTPVKQSAFVIKHQPDKMCLSTIESVHMLLDEMNRQNVEQLNEKHHKMLVAFKALNDYQIECASNPAISSYRRGTYKVPKDRAPSKKWQKRKLIVD